MNCCTVGRSRYSSDPKWIQIQNCPEPIATPLKVINTACSNRKHNVIPKTKNSSSSHRCIAITSTHLFLHSLSAVISSKTPPTPTQTHSLHRTHHPTTTTPPSGPKAPPDPPGWSSARPGRSATCLAPRLCASDPGLALRGRSSEPREVEVTGFIGPGKPGVIVYRHI